MTLRPVYVRDIEPAQAKFRLNVTWTRERASKNFRSARLKRSSGTGGYEGERESRRSRCELLFLPRAMFRDDGSRVGAECASKLCNVCVCVRDRSDGDAAVCFSFQF